MRNPASCARALNGYGYEKAYCDSLLDKQIKVGA